MSVRKHQTGDLRGGAGAQRGYRPTVAAADVDHRSGRADPFPVRFPVVALIASAAGVQALIRILQPLPAAAIATHHVQQILGLDAIADAVIRRSGGLEPPTP